MAVPRLSVNARRVLGVLMEKSFATPDQYPLTINAIVTGANQKTCRDPILHLDDDQVWKALDELREIGVARLFQSTSGRTERFRHVAGEFFGIDGRESAVLAELLLRGPQTDGELRGRANRLVKIPGLPELAEVLEKLESRDEPLVRRLSPPGRKRGIKYAHTLYPAGKEPALEDDAGDDDAEPESGALSRGARSTSAGADLDALVARIEELEMKVAEMESKLGDLLA